MVNNEGSAATVNLQSKFPETTPAAVPDLTVTIVSWNTRELLDSCLQSLKQGAGARAIEVVVVDNGSTDGSPEWVRDHFPEVRLIRNARNVGFAKANNQSWAEARGRYWMLLNSDTVVRPKALDRLISFMEVNPRAGLVSARLVNPDGTPQFCAQPDPSVGLVLFEASRLHKLLPRTLQGRLLLSSYWTYDQSIELGWTWGTALIARREAVEEVGPLRDDFFFYGEDVEWCLRMRRLGWKVRICSDAEVLHHGGQSAKATWDDSSRRERINDGFYKAVGLHKGRLYALTLEMSTLAALSVNRLASRCCGRGSVLGSEISLRYLLTRLKGCGRDSRERAEPKDTH